MMKNITLIKQGQVHNGDRFLGTLDLLVDGDRVVDVGQFDVDVANQIIDASGCVVSPGFIDVQNMTFQLNTLDKNEGINLITQGVTSTIIGNCGNSGALESESDFIQRLEYLQKISLGLNVGMLVGHNSLRKFVLQDSERVANPGEIKKMRGILETALEKGALGLSTGLMYSPGIFADREEIKSLVSLVASYDRVYATHMRDEGDQLLEAVSEAMDTARDGDNCRLVISHFKVTGKRNWGKSDSALNMIDQRRKMQDVYMDYYPYSATATVLSIVLLPEILRQCGGDLHRLQFNVTDEKIIELEGKQNLCLNGWADVVIATSQVPNIVGKSIQAISGTRSPYQCVVDILNQDPETRVVFHNIASEDELQNVAKRPYAMVVTDGYIYPQNSTKATHPRNYGAFPRSLVQNVFTKPIYSLEEFISRSSSLPALVYNLKQRGVIQKGSFADVIVFNPDDIRENATYEKPYLLSTGVKHVMINGEIVLFNNNPVQKFPGRLLL